MTALHAALQHNSNIGLLAAPSQWLIEPLCVTTTLTVINVTGPVLLLEAGYWNNVTLWSEVGMKRLPEVKAATELMNEAMKWSVMKWLREKKHVRRTADQANAALDRCRDELKRRWPENLRVAYEHLAAEIHHRQSGVRTPKSVAFKDAEARALACKLKDADDQAYRARMLAKQAFDDAERKLSTSLAREGCVKAIASWELCEKALVQSEKLTL